MPREADINTRFEAGSSEEGTPLDPAKSSLFTVGASNYANVKVVHRKTDGLRFPRRTHGASYRNRVIVISDSESDSELPSPSQLLQGRDLVGPASNLGSLASTNEIIEISSDSEIEATPTKPRGGKSSSGTQGYRTTSAVSPSSTSVSALAGAFHDSLFVHTTRSPSRAESVGHPQSDGTTPLSQPTEANSTDSEELDETKFFDPDASHPGILLFNPGPRKPALVTSSLGTPISTQKTSDHSQDLCGEGRARTSIQADDSCEDIEEIKNPNKSAKSRGATGNGKASNSGYRSQIRNDIEGTVLPETPRPRARPKPKARSVALTSESASVSLSPKPAPRNQAKVLQAAAILLFAELNSSVFGGKLPKDCPIEWSKKLNTTAGRAHWKRIRDANGNVARHDTRIELSTKVVDCEERIKNTLSHEMCHLAAWIFDSEMKPPHGPAFKRWSDRIMEARPDIIISTCHSYEISYKYEWKCSSEQCGRTYGRHSKSIDPEKQVCGACSSKLIPQFETAPKRTAFQAYLKTHMKDFKVANPGMQHGEVMRRLGEMFRAEKEATVDEELDQVMAGMTKLGINSHIG